MGLPRLLQKLSAKAAADGSSLRARKAWISSGVARREMGPTSQADQSGPRRGLIRSAMDLGALAPPQPASSASSRRAGAHWIRLTLSTMAEEVQELFAHLFLVEDAAQRRGHRQGPRLLDAPHLDAQVARLDHHHGPQRLELR